MNTIQGSSEVRLSSGYRLLLPNDPPPAGGFPLLLALHGFSLTGKLLQNRLRSMLSAPYALLFPDGPFPVEVRQAQPPRIGYSWYQYTGDQQAFLAALDFSIAHLERLLERVGSEHSVDVSRVVLLGYSQGGYLASFMALQNRQRFLGLVTISCRIKVEALTDQLPALSGFPILVLHGKQDEVVPLAPQQESVRLLQEHGVAVELLLHEGGHELRRDQVPRIDQFVRSSLGCAPRTS